MVVQEDILISPVIHPKAFRNGAKFGKAKFFIKVDRSSIARYDGIELKDFESELTSSLHAMFYKAFPDVLSPYIGPNGITCIADMAAVSDIIGMKDIEAGDFSCVTVISDTGIGL